MMTQHLRHDEKMLFENLIEGKLPRNLSWADTVELMGKLGTVEPHAHDEVVFVVGGQRELFKKPHTHDLGTDEVSRLRKFLRAAGPDVETPAQAKRMVVVIDHHAAHVYQDSGDGEKTVRPHDPWGFHHHLIHKKEAHYVGERVPEERSFYEEVAAALKPANEIVLIGHGTGTSSAVEHLLEFLKKNHSDIAERVKATETADLSALTEPEIEAIAKKHMIAVVG
jgi:hypothetical protein